MSLHSVARRDDKRSGHEAGKDVKLSAVGSRANKEYIKQRRLSLRYQIKLIPRNARWLWDSQGGDLVKSQVALGNLWRQFTPCITRSHKRVDRGQLSVWNMRTHCRPLAIWLVQHWALNLFNSQKIQNWCRNRDFCFWNESTSSNDDVMTNFGAPGPF